ncbi:MAG: hypothetical protein PVH62_07160 [Anaerolineae bacterium]|jgi:cell division protein FtsB
MKKESQNETWVLAAGALVGLAILAALGRGIWGQVEQLRRIQAAEAKLLPVVSRERERQEELLDTLRRVSSPGYAEEWARIYAGMVRPGEVRLVVPLPEE